MTADNLSTRRGFLATAGAATLGALVARPALEATPNTGSRKGNKSEEKIVPTADAVIVLWMAGGMAHTETFDPKRYTPFEKGLESNAVLSTFRSIPTAIDGVRISQGLEKIAAVLDRGTLIRTHVAADLGKILHSRHQYHWHTGYEPPQTVAAPHIGAWIAHAKGPQNPALPAFIDIGQRYDGNGEAEELKAFQTGGCLGAQYGPFRVPDPEQAVLTVRPPAGMSQKRFRRRFDAYKKLIAESPVARESDFQREVSVAIARERAPPDERAGRQGVRFIAWSRRSRESRTRPDVSARAACWPGGSLRPEPGSSRSRRNTCRFLVGTRTTMDTRGWSISSG